MQRDLKQDRNEILFDALLKAAAREVHQKEMEAFPTEDECVEMLAGTGALERLDTRIHALINKEVRTSQIQAMLRKTSQVAAIFCIVLVLTAGATMAHPASRNFILSYIMDLRDDHVVFDFGLVPTNGSENVTAFMFHYMPSGFELINTAHHDNVAMYIFENDAGHFIIMRRSLGHTLSAGFDYENAYLTQVQLSGGNAYMFISQYEYGFNSIMWIQGGYVFTFSTTLNADILIPLAEIYMGK